MVKIKVYYPVKNGMKWEVLLLFDNKKLIFDKSALLWLCGHRIHQKVSSLNLLQFGNAFEHLALQLKSDISQWILSYEVLLHVMEV